MTRHISRSIATLAAAALLAFPLSASAQAPPSPKTPPAETATPAPPSATHCTPQGGTAPGSTTGQSSSTQPLGDQLARTDGVLCPPPGVDPAIRAPAPDVGKTPVIPPPGSPGGDPSVRPK